MSRSRSDLTARERFDNLRTLARMIVSDERFRGERVVVEQRCGRCRSPMRFGDDLCAVCGEPIRRSMLALDRKTTRPH